MASARPYRVCGLGRGGLHGLAASSLRELREKGCVILSLSAAPDEVKVVLEEDGTLVDDDEYLQLLDENPYLMLLQPNERWEQPREQEEVETDGRHLSESEEVARMLHRDLGLIVNLSDSQLRAVVEEEPDALVGWLGSERRAELVSAACGRVLDERQHLRDIHAFLDVYHRAEEHHQQGHSQEATADVTDSRPPPRFTDPSDPNPSDPHSAEQSPADTGTYNPPLAVPDPFHAMWQSRIHCRLSQRYVKSQFIRLVPELYSQRDESVVPHLSTNQLKIVRNVGERLLSKILDVRSAKARCIIDACREVLLCRSRLPILSAQRFSRQQPCGD